MKFGFKVLIIVISSFLGGVVGGVAYKLFVSPPPPIVFWVVSGIFIGIFLTLFWPFLRAFALRLRIEDLQLEDVEIQGFKFTSAGAQRRVAWRLFIEITTRVSTQPMSDEAGDNGVVLGSLYDLFQLARKTISEMESTPNATGDTVETYSLDMLNNDLRPFLSKWHPAWNNFAKGEKVVSQTWPDHKQFRAELKQLQKVIENRARGLAQLAGVKNSDRFFARQQS